MSEETVKEFTKEIKGIKIDPIIFTFKFNCICNGECCNYGVYTDLKEHDHIQTLQNKILTCMDETQTKEVSRWFEAPEEDEDFDSGIAVGTEIHNGKCTFLDKNGLCTLQKISMDEGKHKWENKPLYCVLFPLTIYQGALTVDDEHIDRLHYCNKHENKESTLFEYCKEEIIHLLGEDGYKELSEYREEYFSTLNNGNNNK